jgi:hypothetical protein
MSLVAGGMGIGAGKAPVVAKEGRKHKKRGKKAKKAAEEAEAGESGERGRKKRKHKKKHGHGYTLEDDTGVAGLVQIEIVGAKGLPRFKNGAFHPHFLFFSEC